LTPIFDGDFQETAGERFTAMLHGVSPDEAANARGSITSLNDPLRFSTEQKTGKNSEEIR
jgi:hypothetical protein